MPKVNFTVVHSVEMDEHDTQDIKEIANQLAKGAVANVESIVQEVSTSSIKAEFIKTIDCMEVTEQGVLNA